MRFGRYTWNDQKAADNIRDHGVSFEEASTAIEDPYAIVDADDARGERRLNVTGYSSASRILFVVCIERFYNNTTHIISARKAEPSERRTYENGE